MSFLDLLPTHVTLRSPSYPCHSLALLPTHVTLWLSFLPMSLSGSPSYPCHSLALLPTHATLWLSFLPMSLSGSPSYPCHSLALPLSGEGTGQGRFTMIICWVILKWALSERWPWQETTPLSVNLYWRHFFLFLCTPPPPPQPPNPTKDCPSFKTQSFSFLITCDTYYSIHHATNNFNNYGKLMSTLHFYLSKTFSTTKW